MIVQIVTTTQDKLYVRIFGLRKTFLYELTEAGQFEPCPPPTPGNLALAKVEQRSF